VTRKTRVKRKKPREGKGNSPLGINYKIFSFTMSLRFLENGPLIEEMHLSPFSFFSVVPELFSHSKCS